MAPHPLNLLPASLHTALLWPGGSNHNPPDRPCHPSPTPALHLLSILPFKSYAVEAQFMLHFLQEALQKVWSLTPSTIGGYSAHPRVAGLTFSSTGPLGI